MMRGLSKVELGLIESACLDFKKAVEIGSNPAKELLEKYCK